MVNKQDRFELKGSVSAEFDDGPRIRALLDQLGRDLERTFTNKGVSKNARPRRQRYAVALVKLTRFFAAAGLPSIVVTRFQELRMELYDRDQGVPPRGVLKSAPLDHRPQAPSYELIARAYVAIAVLAIADEKKCSVGNAAKDLAKTFPALREALSPKSDDFAGIIRKWPEWFSEKGGAPDGPWRSIFEARKMIIQGAREKLIADGRDPTADAIAEIIIEMAIKKMDTAE